MKMIKKVWGGMVKKSILFLFLMTWVLTMVIPGLSQGETASEGSSQAGAIPEGKPLAETSKIETRSGFGIGLGVRSTYFQMQKNKGEIFGNINLLDEEQNYLPYKPLAQINLTRYLALELGYDQFKAKTLNRAYQVDNVFYAEHDKRLTDGTIKWEPFMLSLQFRWPHFHKSLVPYLLGGVSYTKTSWERQDWYYYGSPDPMSFDEWISQGRRPEDFSSVGYRRIFALEDKTIGTLFGLGLDYFITKNWALNLDWRYHWAKVNFTYTLAFDDGRDVIRRQDGAFVLDSWIAGFGLKYFF
jgi:hypothetical protein